MNYLGKLKMLLDRFISYERAFDQEQIDATRECCEHFINAGVGRENERRTIFAEMNCVTFRCVGRGVSHRFDAI